MNESFEEGFDSAISQMKGAVGEVWGNNYIHNIHEAITKLENNINNFKGLETQVDQLQGDIAEYWHGGTFNINSAVNDSSYSVNVDRSHEFASPDIRGNWEGSDHGLKYYKYANKSVNAQATSYFERFKVFQKTHPDATFEDFLTLKGVDIDTLPHSSIYSGQIRIIPVNQYEEALAYLNIKIQRELLRDPELAQRYIEVRELLTTKISAPDGTESIVLDRDASERIAKIAKEGKFDAANEGITIPNLVEWEHILKQSVKAGLTASVITLVMQTAPSIYKCIDQLIMHGYITNEQLAELGGAAIKGSGEGFTRGFISGLLCVACQSGKFGATLMTVSPGIIGACTVLICQTLKDSISVIQGTISRQQFFYNLNNSIFITGFAIGFGFFAQWLLPMVPFSYLLGNFVGSFIGSFIYKEADKAIMALAVEHGWTFFGLVDQDYQLPEEVLKELGIDIFEYEDDFVLEDFDLDTFQLDIMELDKYEPEMIRIVRRGVIGVHQVGYTF